MNESDRNFLRDFIVQPLSEKIDGVEDRLRGQICTLTAASGLVPDRIQQAIADHVSALHSSGGSTTTNVSVVTPRPSWLSRATALVPGWLRVCIILALGALVGGGAAGITVDLARGEVQLNPSPDPTAPTTDAAHTGDAPVVDAGPDRVRQLP